MPRPSSSIGSDPGTMTVRRIFSTPTFNARSSHHPVCPLLRPRRRNRFPLSTRPRLSPVPSQERHVGALLHCPSSPEDAGSWASINISCRPWVPVEWRWSPRIRIFTPGGANLLTTEILNIRYRQVKTVVGHSQFQCTARRGYNAGLHCSWRAKREKYPAPTAMDKPHLATILVSPRSARYIAHL